MSAGRGRVALVSDVLERLLAEERGGAFTRPVLFQAALQACAEESRLVQRGDEARPIDALVARAREILALPPGAPRSGTAAFATPPAEPPPPEPDPDDPFRTAPVPPTTTSPDTFADPPEAPGPGGVAGRRLSPLAVAAALGPLLLAGVVLFLYMRPRLGPAETETAAASSAAPSPAVGLPSGGGAPPPGAGAGVGPPPTSALSAAAVATPAPAPRPTRTTPPSPTAVSGGTAPVPAPPRGDPQTMLSPDWTGRAPAFVIHFSSYRERAKAERDAVALTRRYGRPAYAARVDLPGGVWYRVVLGDFPSAGAARAFRDALAAAGTPELGGVYRVAAP